MISTITVLFLIYAVHNYLTYESTINDAKKITLLRSEAQANNIIQDLDKYIDSRMNDFRDTTKLKQIQLAVKDANKQSSSSDMNELEFTLDASDNNIKTLQQKNILKNKISDEFQSFILSYKNEYDYNVIKELLVTDQRGAVISLVAGKSDYIQADEDWWQATKDKQEYVGDLSFDKDYNDYVIPFAFPILDESSNYIGTLRIVLSHNIIFRDFLNDADVLRETKKSVILVDENGNIIFENGVFFPSKPPIEYFAKLTEDNGSFEFGSPDPYLISYASSIGYKNFYGFGWTAIIEQRSSVIEEFEILERNFLISTIIGIASATILGIVVSRFVTKPLSRLSNLTSLLGKGDFDVKVQRSKISEIDSIMYSFKEMEVSLKKLFETEKKLTEANTRIKNERLAAIGELAASMAHDMKNPLGTIRTGMDIIKRNDKLNPEIESVIQRMDRAVSRMSHQVEDVLNYVRRTPLSIKPVSLKTIIRSSLASIEIPKTIQLDIGNGDITINCDEKKMEVVFINLILNSIQAIGQDEGKISIRIRQTDKKTIIEIEDSGSGIPEKIISDVFKPLVTTKQKGTGLGLASCKNIIEQHGGTITFRNNPTVFTITLPIGQNV